MSIPNNSLLLGAPVSGPSYTISRSVRFNSADTTYLSRTPSATSNQRTWTLSWWVKRSTLGAGEQVMFAASQSTPNNYQNYISFFGDSLRFFHYNGTTTTINVTSTDVFRDTAAWMHIVVQLDTTQAAVLSDRLKFYVNNRQLTLSGFPAFNETFFFNTASIVHSIGDMAGYSPGIYPFNGYLADIHFIDGQALTPSSFAEISAATGRWEPKAYTGTYGTNGFRLDFSDNSAATATTLGKDRAGSNNWTPVNLSITAGPGNDSLLDTPTSYGTDTGTGGQARGNYATLNPLSPTGASARVLRNGNLDFGSSGSANTSAVSTIGVSSGKWYLEVNVGTTPTYHYLGIYNRPDGHTASALALIESTNSISYNIGVGGTFSGSGTWNIGDVIGIALDLDGGSITWYKNGVSIRTLTGATLNTNTWHAGCTLNAATSVPSSFNFGQRPFAYPAPSGFKALCDTNLPTPTIAKGSTAMDVKLWTGNGGNQTISGLGFSPDFVWVKQRDNTNSASHVLVDIVRGNNNVLRTNGADAENSAGIDPALYDGITNLAAASFETIKGSSTVYNGTNGSGKSYVGWTWDAGSATVTNTQGSITSTVRANPSAGFSIVAYTGSGTNATIGHGLGVAPALIIIKARTAAYSWPVYHQAVGNTSFGVLDSTAAFAANNTAWNNTSPSSTVFTVGTGTLLNQASISFVAYCWAPVAGYSSFGAWQNNGNNDGTFVYLGFRPRFILLKNTDNTENWYIMDSSRHAYNVLPADATKLSPNAANAEGPIAATTATIDFLSNGFKIRTTNTASGEISFGTRNYIYAAFAESPFQFSRAR